LGQRENKKERKEMKKCNCFYCRTGMLADFQKRWQERPGKPVIQKKDKETENENT